MHPLVQSKLEPLVELCARHGVRRLDLIGSASRADFDPDRSDLDFVVQFNAGPRLGLKGPYFRLLADLEDLFGRRIDLIEFDAIENPYFLDEVKETRVPLYAA